MDLNQLYFDHQILLIKAGRASSAELRHEHEVSASHIAGRIGCMQRSMGASGAPSWDALAAIDNRSLAGPVRHQQGYLA
ncbi:hypothetical protein KK137_04720 [Croceibacterium sp. LX-88]|uniref:Uncharacterized protein n=1 Tax=Croceibacterium selenioxidans TaxID=2838833 RepID=A0ABS5W1J0_9SPHN|nr:hypothetical protein [Croceibacterium selenioxidans]MBT2133630.1 hypothetical protein [Croceibacterium selenioxidans]